MKIIEPTRTHQHRTPSVGAESSPPEVLNQARAEADRLLAAGDAAIRKALARGNSEAFLRSAMQTGGQ